MPLILLSCLPAFSAIGSAGSTDALQAEARRIAATAAGEVGVAAWRLDGKGPQLLINADQQFPMASSFKIAVAGAVLARIDAGLLRLTQMIPVDHELKVESDVIAKSLIHPGVSLSVENLLELMLTQSDNTATDILTKAAGGPAEVTAWVKKQGISGLRVDRDTAGILRDFFLLPAGPFAEALAAARKSDSKLDDRSDKPNPSYDDDARDTATPAAMATLLTRLFLGQALSPASTKVLIGVMERCHTGDNRLRAHLPAGTTVADKTGTLGASLNDVGVVTLPEGRGQVVIAVYIKKSTLPFAARERVIADLGRAIYDYFLFTETSS